MTRANPALTAFNFGEFSPRMVARIGLEQYDNACAQAENLLPLPQGGLARCPGTRYVAEVKTSASQHALLRFQFSTEQAYIIEAGPQHFRFYRNQGQITAADIGASITNGTFDSNITGWTDSSNGTGAISHDSTNDRLSLDGAGSSNEAIAEQSVTTTTTATVHVLKFETAGLSDDTVTVRVGSSSGASDYLADLDLTTGTHTVSFTPSASPFYVQFEYGGSRGGVGIDNVSLIDNAAVEIATPYASADLLAIKYTQSADVMYLAHPDYQPRKLLRRGNTDWSLVLIDFQNGPFFSENSTAVTLTLGGTSGSVSVTASAITAINGGSGFLTTDVGRLIRFNDAAGNNTWFKITARTSTTVVTAEIRGPDASATTAQTTWALGLWSDTTGWPGAVAFFEERLYFAGASDTPQRIDGSVVADFEVFRPLQVDGSVLDDDAVAFTIASEEVNRIRWMSGARELVIGTTGSEFTASSAGAAITPTDIAVKRQTKHGCADVAPVRVDNRLLFLQRAGRKIRDFFFEFAEDSFISSDVTLFADHITTSGITQMAYQQEPDSLVWCVRTDGQVATLVFKPGERVTGWSRQVLGGSFGSGNAVVESVASIPGQNGVGQTTDSSDRDEVWLIVKRTINGATVRYVEFVEAAFEGPLRESYDTEAAWETAVLAAQVDAFYVSSGLTYDSTATTTITGLDHLEGETVAILADGAVHPSKTVSSGSITLDYSASVVQAGLAANWKYGSLKFPAGGRAGPALAKKKRTAKVGLVLKDTASFQFGSSKENLKTKEFRAVADLTDTAVPLFTGEVLETLPSNWSTDPRVFLQGPGPTPFTLLALTPELWTNDLV
jgi:hypothetical protein